MFWKFYNILIDMILAEKLGIYIDTYFNLSINYSLKK